MVTPSVGLVVLVPFPFSDLSRAKLRPAVVLADAGKLFTANNTLMTTQVGNLKDQVLKSIVDAIINILTGR